MIMFLTKYFILDIIKDIDDKLNDNQLTLHGIIKIKKILSAIPYDTIN